MQTEKLVATDADNPGYPKPAPYKEIRTAPVLTAFCLPPILNEIRAVDSACDLEPTCIPLETAKALLPFKISDIRHTTDVSPNQTVDSAIDPPTAQILEISDIPIELPMTEIQIAPLEATLKPAILLSNGVPKEKPSDTEPDEPAVKEILPDLNKPALYLHATAVSEDHREDSNAELRKRTVPVEVLFPKPNPEIERKQEPVDTLFEAKIEILIFVASNEKKWEEETRKLPTLRLKR